VSLQEAPRLSPFATAVRRLSEPRTIGWFGALCGLLAFWLALPPWTLRDLAGPIAAGFVGVACGLAVVTRGQRKLGWWAIGLGVLGPLGAVWLQTKDADTLDSILTAGVLASTLRFATPLAFAAMGGLVSERSGVVNIGLEGMMLIGAFFGLWAADWGGTWVVGVLVAMVSGGVLALIHAFFSIHLRADQIVSGFAVNFLALGLTGYLFSALYPDGIPSGISRVPNVDLGFLDGIPAVGDFLADMLGDLNLLVWVMFGAVILVWIVLFKTPVGLRVRSVGEHPRAAETVGISVYGVRYAAVTASGVLAALGGAFLSIGFVGTFAENMTSGRGFIALAAMIFGKWLPFPAFAATLLFGFGFALAIPLQREAGVSENIISTLPYVLTLIALVGLIGRSIPPAADGKPYVKQ
jgi:simple sugar transport system permease protein